MTHRPGTVRWVDAEGQEHICSPHAPAYSSALFAAQDVWCDEAQSWRPIYTEDWDNEDPMPENSAP